MRSSTQYNSSAPLWGEGAGEMLAVSVFDQEELRRKLRLALLSDEIRIEAFSPNTFGPPHLLGTVTFPLANLVAGLESRGVGEGWYELQDMQGPNAQLVKGQNGEAAQVYVRLSYAKAN